MKAGSFTALNCDARTNETEPGQGSAEKLKSMTSHARLDDVPTLAAEILAGQTRGRVVIDL
jgi:hypothetical protein